MFRSLLLAVALASATLSIPKTALAGQAAQTSKATIQADLSYLLYTPSDYETSGKAYPLVVWLHGGDQGGSDIEKVRRSGLPKLIEGGKEFPFLVFSPQNPSEELLYPIEKVDAALEEVIASHRVDRSRIYVIGYSRGAFGAWALAEQFRNGSRPSSRSPAAATAIISAGRTKRPRSGYSTAPMTMSFRCRTQWCFMSG